MKSTIILIILIGFFTIGLCDSIAFNQTRHTVNNIMSAEKSSIPVIRPPDWAIYLTLHWEPVDDPRVRDYIVYYGRTTPPKNTINVKNRAFCDIVIYPVLGHSNDYYFSVVSVDDDGNEDSMSEILKWKIMPSPPQGIYIERKVRKLWITY